MAISPAGSGALDVNGIVSQLMSVEQRPLLALASKEASFRAKLSGFGTLKGALAQFQTAVRALSDVSKFQGMRVSSADASIVSASGNATASAGSYALEVTKLAQSQKLAGPGQLSSTVPIGSGAATTLSFDFGSIAGGAFDAASGKYTGAAFTSNGVGVKTVVIGASNNSLSGIRDAINKAAIGVSATIVNDGGTSPYRLALSSNTTGQTNSLKISVAGDATIAALLDHNPGNNTGQAFSETTSAQNAVFKVDGIAVSKTSNSVTDVIQGVALNLMKTNSGSPTTISVTRDTAAVTAAVDNFVKAYNDISKNLKEVSAYNPTTKQAAILNGESSIRAIEADIRKVLAAPVAGAGGAYSQLFQVGVSMQKDGLLVLDNAKLQGAIEKNFGDIAALFAAVGRASDSLVSYSGATARTVPGAYNVNVSRIATNGASTGSASAGLTITAGSNDALEVLLDGVSATVTLTPGVYPTPAALAVEVQARINGVEAYRTGGSSSTVTEANGILTLTSSRYGSASKVAITGGNGMLGLMGTTVVSTDGLDVAGSINGVPASGAGQVLTAAAGNSSEGLRITLAGGSTGSRGTISYSQGYAHQFDKLMESQLGTVGLIASRTDGINSSLKNLSDSRIRVNDRLAIIEKRYRAQFTALDVTISSMQTTGNFLTQQLAALANNR